MWECYTLWPVSWCHLTRDRGTKVEATVREELITGELSFVNPSNNQSPQYSCEVLTEDNHEGGVHLVTIVSGRVAHNSEVRLEVALPNLRQVVAREGLKNLKKGFI